MAKLANFPKPEEGFTGSEIYFQDKFDEFDWATRYNRLKPKEGFEQIWRDIKDSTKMEKDEWGKPPPIPPALLKAGLGFIVKQLASGKFNQGKRDFLEKIVKPPKPKPKLDKPKEFKWDDEGLERLKQKWLDKINLDKNRTLHQDGGLAGMLGEPRSGYQGGGHVEYWTMVQESFINAGGQDATGMNIQDFAQMYFPRSGQAEGGRIGMLAGGLLTSGIMNALRMVKDIGYAMKGGKGGIPWPGGHLYPKGFKSMISTKLEKALALKQQLKNNILGYKDILKSFKKEKRPKFEIEDVRLGLKDAKEGLKKIDKYIEIQPKNLTKHAQGGRIGLAEGDTPSEAWMRDYFYKAGYDRKGVITLDDYMHGPKGLGWKDYMEHGPGKAEGGRIGYDNGGSTEQEDYDAYVAEKEGAGEEYMDFDMWKQFQLFDWGKAEGGRIGFQDGRGIMSRVGDMVDARNVPYYGGKALQGLVNSAETLSKFPFAAGELGSKLIQQPPKKEMFMEAIENITPGSWSENLGLTSLVEGMGEKRPKDAQTVGGILGLGTEVAVPTGGAFKAGQFLLSKASKAMGKVKDGKTLEKLVDEKLTDAGQSRRDFNIMAITSGLGIALKSIGLGGLFKAATKVKPSDDVVIRLRTWIDDSDVDTEWGPVATAKFGGAFDIEGLSTAAQKTLEKISDKGFGWSKRTTQGKKNYLPTYEDVPLEDGSYIADILKKAGHKVRFEHLDDVGGSGVDEILWRFKNDPMYKGTKEGAEEYKKFSEKVKKMTERQKIEYHNSLTDDYGRHYSSDVEDTLDVLMPVKKAEGGRIGLGTGGPPLQLGIAESKWQAMHPVQGNKISQLKDAAMDRVFPGTGITGSLNMGNFEAFYNQPLIDPMNMFEKSENPQYGLQYEKGPFSAGVGVMPDGEREYGFKLRKEFNDGGLTKTIPPKRGPDPQGLPSALYNGIMRPRSY